MAIAHGGPVEALTVDVVDEIVIHGAFRTV